MRTTCPPPRTVYRSTSCRICLSLSIYLSVSPWCSALITTESRRLWLCVLMLRQNWTRPFCPLNTNIVHKHSFIFDQNHKYLGICCTELWRTLVPKLSANDITNSRNKYQRESWARHKPFGKQLLSSVETCVLFFIRKWQYEGNVLWLDNNRSFFSRKSKTDGK